MRHKFLIVIAALFLIGCNSSVNAGTTQLVLQDSVVKQYTEWLSEVDKELADNFIVMEPYILAHQTGQSEFLRWMLDNNGSIPLTVPSKNALDAGEWIVKSYMRSNNRIITLSDGSKTTRKEISDSMNDVLFSLDRIVKLVEKPVKTTLPIIVICDSTSEDCTQFAQPLGNVSCTPYIQATGRGDDDSDCFDELDEGVVGGSGPDDELTYWFSEGNPSSSCISIDWAGNGLSDPAAGNRLFNVRIEKSSNSTLDTTWNMMEALSIIQTVTKTDHPPTKDIWITSSDLIVASITDYDDLQGEICATKVGGGPNVVLRVTGMEFEIPDPPSGVRRRITTTES